MPLEACGGGTVAEVASLSIRDSHRDLHGWFFSPSVELDANGDALLSFGLIPAMVVGADLRVATPTSNALVASTRAIQEIIHAWDHRLRTIRVEATVASSTRKRLVGRSAAFFSGGVDSCFTLLRHVNEIDALIFIAGFDTPLSDESLLVQGRRGVLNAADELGKELVEVQTDIREATRRVVDWRLYHGAAMAAIGHLLREEFTTFYVPSSVSSDATLPCGSHPELDHLWSSEAIRFVHDGVASRFAKVTAIASNPVAMRWLRVCNVLGRSTYNCGTCQKCLCTNVALTLAGKGGECESLPESLDLGRLASLRVASPEFFPFWQENLLAAKGAANQETIMQVLELVLTE